ncbi:S9 family peptidase [Acidithrix sp. C25]|uniref:S9 family peptidase n=1 Tax=Acidithrix sp. C25 TaxID=1671482 RepID=UPI00191BAC3D|nr:S9 family peptidase [Acidithrix sp. C25]
MLNEFVLDLETLAKRPYPGTTVPISPTFSKNSPYLYFLMARSSDSNNLSLCRGDLDGGGVEVLIDGEDSSALPTLAEELRRERLRLSGNGVSGFVLFESDTKSLILVNVGGHYLIYDPDLARVSYEFEGESIERIELDLDNDAAVCTDGKRLYRVDLSGGESTTIDEVKGEGQLIGVAEFVAQEELDRLEGFWLSGDGRRIAYCVVDQSGVEPFWIFHYGAKEIRAESHRYPFAGAPNAKVGILIDEVESLGVKKGSPRAIDLETDSEDYIAKVSWLDSKTLLVATLNRRQTTLTWHFVDCDTAAVVARIEDKLEPWVNLPSSVLPIDANRFITTTERSGFSHVAIYNSNGVVDQVTFGEWMVTSLVDFDPESGYIYFVSTIVDPCARDLSRVHISGGAPELMTSGEGVHDCVVSIQNRAFLDIYSCLSHSYISRVMSFDSEVLLDLGDEPLTPQQLALTSPLRFEFDAVDGTRLIGHLYLPGDRNPRGLPLVISVYGGPHAQRVTNSWSSTIDLEAQYLASRGVVVAKIDNRGSYGRGLDFEAKLSRKFGTIELEDQISGIDYLSERFGIDPNRVGIYGWSYGGFMTLSALTKHPDRFIVGVAGAPVVDFSFYDTAYTERYMGTPVNEGPAYEIADVTNYVESLKGKLAIIHGLIDENVHFRNTAYFLEAAIAHGKKVDQMILPQSRHMPRGQETLLQIARMRTSYLLEALT